MLTSDTRHDTRGYLGPCPYCGGDVHATHAVKVWPRGSETPTWAHEECAREEGSMFRPGEAVTWMYTHRGGYGYTRAYAATVVKATAKRVTITVTSLLTGKLVQKSVKPESLRKAA